MTQTAKKQNREEYKKYVPYLIIILGGLAVRLAASLISLGHPTDINCFMAWSDMLYKDGFRAFYASNAMTDYPPGYMYILYLIGAIRDGFSLPYMSYSFSLLCKTPAIVADICSGILLYNIAKNKGTTKLSPLAVSSFYVFNPLVIFISAVWGQVDSIYGLVIAMSLYQLVKKKDLYAYLFFAVSIMIKPQSLMFAPIYLFLAVKKLSENKFSREAVLSFVVGLAAVLGLMILLLMPFTTWPIVSFKDGFVLTPVLKQYADTLASYPYATVNAYNIYALFGLNWGSLEGTFLNISFGIWGIATILAAIILCFTLLRRKDSAWSIFYAGAFICAFVFMFSVKMHERYFFPMLILLLFSYIYSGNKKTVLGYIIASLAGFANCVDILAMALNDNNYGRIELTSRIFPVLWLAALGYMAYTVLTDYKNKMDVFKDFSSLPKDPVIQENTEIAPKWSRKDLILISSLTILYACIAFFRLGNMSAPETYWTPKPDEEVIFDLGQPRNDVTMRLFNGARHDKGFTVSYSDDGINFWRDAEEGKANLNTGQVFAWKRYDLNSAVDYRYVKVIARDSDMYIMEIAFEDQDGKLIQPLVSAAGEALIDEQGLAAEANYMNGVYFDEVYHPRTAYEFLNGMDVYETSHPPLGKLIMAVGISIFGMNPFGWRFMGTLAGVLMIPLVYVMARRILKRRNIAFFAAFVFAFDFMHFVQTRLATIDSYLVLFVIAQYYFMYRYYELNFNDVPVRKTFVPLFLSGLFMGLGAAVKWSGIYAGAGLAVIFFIVMYRRYRDKETDFRSKTIKTLSACLIFFVVIPVCVYVLSYIQHYYITHSLYYTGDSLKGFLSGIIQNQQSMLSYHGGLEATHAYGSDWWTWPFNLVPMWYYSNSSDGLRAGISSFGNPAVWWGGLAAIAVMVYMYVKNRDKRVIFILIGYLAQLLPWALVSRVVFIYHYFPCIPFLALGLGYVFRNIKWRYAVMFMGVTGVLFILFFPVLSGIPVDADMVRKALRWLPDWVLI